MRELDDSVLELRLRTVLAERLGALELGLTAEELERRRRTQIRARGKRRPLIILGLAAALLVPVGWLAAGAPLPAPAVLVSDASPSPDAVVTPTFDPDATSPTTVGDYQAIEVRRVEADPDVASDIDVVAIRADGEERVLTTLDAARMPAGFVAGPSAYVSPDGWLAIGAQVGGGLVLVDLGQPAAPMRNVQGDTDPEAWRGVRMGVSPLADLTG